MKFLAISTLVIFSSLAHADIYNECVAVGDSNSGIYFENGYSQTSPNSSEHYFEHLVLVAGGTKEIYKISGDRLYKPDCMASEDSTSKVGISKSSYVTFDERLTCARAKLEVQVDLSKAQPNGKIVRTLANGQQVTLDLNCK